MHPNLTHYLRAHFCDEGIRGPQAVICSLSIAHWVLAEWQPHLDQVCISFELPSLGRLSMLWGFQVP